MRNGSENSRLLEAPAPETVEARLRRAGLRATLARKAVLSCLMATQRPLTHAQVCERLVDQAHDRATVYRNLLDLSEAGILARQDLGDHLWRFELADAPGHEGDAHPHFVCSECGDVACLPERSVSFHRQGSISQKPVQIQVRGVCADCD